MASLAVVEDLEVLGDRVGELDPGAPSLSVQEFDLYACPEGLDGDVIEAVVHSRGQRNTILTSEVCDGEDGPAWDVERES